LIDGVEKETKITSFDMFCLNRDGEIVKKVCPSLIKWAGYLLEPYEDIEDKEENELNSDNSQRGPMHSYEITNDDIKWKSKMANETTPTAESAPTINMEELSKFDFHVENYKNPPLIYNIAEALHVCNSRYEKLKKKNKHQKGEHDLVQVGIALIMQMHCNDTEVKNDKTWPETFSMRKEQRF
jgi:hypothetical protein